ncbi:type II toxin-antitoxin system VapC family toxin [Marinimicrobium sp. C6131]|uniref:type II toxin-antitoxin system VapC family toxin n=1 Tax=Marinimicrobium sp. C6131 TaxID=3022676 RepID=UPI00223CFE08|nr:type II toxin-antitoxin system VapC family toxin [Marinimicrobium sp. C6131]UZJ43105.1 type II toxin-antitoxin system VapC family toxin [Marinimicrobium sp. C6131]
MIVLDTHVLVWWVNGDSQLSENARAAIEHEQKAENGLILISAISAWEVAMLIEKGRLALSMSVDDWLDVVAEIESVRFVPLDVAVGVQATRLPGDFHKDPADRMIVSLARHLNAPLVTADEKIRAYKHVRSIW